MNLAFTERPYSGSTYRPRPEIYLDPDGKTLIVATPWGPREAARKVIDRMNDYLALAREDNEATSPFEKVSCLSASANSLRIATLLANETIYREENRNEYRSGVELFAGILEKDEFVWLQLGNPQILLGREGRKPLPLGSQIDLSFDFSEGENLLPGLPSQMLGLDSSINLTLNSFRARAGDRLALVSHSHLPESVFGLDSSKMSVDQLAKLISTSSPNHAFWVGVLQLGQAEEKVALNLATALTLAPESPFGRTIEIDLFGSKAKICSFDCPYCDLGATEVRLNKLKEAGFVPTAAQILEDAQKRFREIHEKGPGVEAVIISGNGEPTLHPEFPEIIAGLIALRDVWLPKHPLVLYTNGCNLDQRRVNEAVNKVDVRVVKLDVGNERLFKSLNAPLSRVTLQKVISGIRLLKDVTIQAMFVQGAIDNTGASDVEDWIEVVGLLKPKAVHIMTATRPSHTLGLKRCDEDTLHTIATKLERRTNLKSLILA